MSNWIDKYKKLVISSHKQHIIFADLDSLFEYEELQQAFENDGFKFEFDQGSKYFILKDSLGNIRVRCDESGEIIDLVRNGNQNKKLKLGICGEHGGDPKSIEFCSKVGLNYVSCSPYRVPIARLAAAQAELKK